jgi:hypothetical protein
MRNGSMDKHTEWVMSGGSAEDLHMWTHKFTHLPCEHTFPVQLYFDKCYLINSRDVLRAVKVPNCLLVWLDDLLTHCCPAYCAYDAPERAPGRSVSPSVSKPALTIQADYGNDQIMSVRLSVNKQLFIFRPLMSYQLMRSYFLERYMKII